MQFNSEAYYLNHKKISFINNDGQDKLLNTKALVIGIGGLGCPCLQALAGCGIGTIGIADFDTISISNLHRQPLFNFTDVGNLKTMVAAEKLSSLNPSIKINQHNIFVSTQNILSLIENYDIIIDCTDNFLVRYLINDACVFLNKPLVFGAIFKTEGHVTVFNLDGSATLRCLFPNNAANEIKSCADIGSYNITTSIIGTMMANEVIKISLRHTNILANLLTIFDTLTLSTKKIKYNQSIDGRNKSLQIFTPTI